MLKITNGDMSGNKKHIKRQIFFAHFAKITNFAKVFRKGLIAQQHDNHRTSDMRMWRNW